MCPGGLVRCLIGAAGYREAKGIGAAYFAYA